MNATELTREKLIQIIRPAAVRYAGYLEGDPVSGVTFTIDGNLDLGDIADAIIDYREGRTEDCGDCAGTGRDGCDSCDATGTRGRGNCRRCNGRGWLECPTCDANGIIDADPATAAEGWPK